MKRVWIAFLLNCLMGSSLAHAGLVTSLSVTQSQDASKVFHYAYLLENLSTSDLPVVSFSLDVSTLANVQAITVPNGWTASYMPGDTAVSWEVTDASFAVMPGTSIHFSFDSVIGPGQGGYLIVGIDDGTSTIDFNEGRIDGPNIALVPEPMSMIPLAIGMATLIGYSSSRRL